MAVTLGDRSWLPLILRAGRGVVLCTSVGLTMQSILTLAFMHQKLTMVTEILRAVRVTAFLVIQGVLLLHLCLIYIIN